MFVKKPQIDWVCARLWRMIVILLNMSERGRQNIKEPFLVTSRKYEDARGWFRETFSALDWVFDQGRVTFVQDNESLSVAAGTIRGLHFQKHPHGQGKLIRVVAGAVMDVATDIRTSSPNLGQSITFELEAESGDQLWIPPGFAHGFCTLKPNTVVAYKATAHYHPESERSIRFDDPELQIVWPVEIQEAVLSDKDRAAPTFAALLERGDLFA